MEEREEPWQPRAHMHRTDGTTLPLNAPLQRPRLTIFSSSSTYFLVFNCLFASLKMDFVVLSLVLLGDFQETKGAC